MAESRIYVYAIVDVGVPPRMQVCGRPLRTLRTGRIAAVVDRRDWRPPPGIPALLQQHDVLVALASRVPALLPVRFGSRLDEPHLRAVLAEHEVTLERALEHVRGRCQMTIRLFGAPTVGAPAATRGAAGAAYLQSRRARRLPPAEQLAVIRQALGHLAADERTEGARPGMCGIVHHLVPARRLRAYRRRALVLQQVLAPVRMTMSGPWPPFAFAPELL